MNKMRRDLLVAARPLLDRAASIIEQVAEQESDCMDNIPENLQSSERYEKMEKAVENLEAALEHIVNAQDYLDEAIS